MAGLYGASADSIYLSPAPNYHAAPLRFIMSMLRLGATCVVMEKFDAIQALQLIERHRVTHSQWVPTMFVRMMKLSEEERARFDVSSLTCAIHAAAPCPVPIKQQLIEWWGPIVHEYYAGTEANGFTAINSEEWLAHKGSVGRPLRGEVHIVGEDGSELPLGEPGAIYFGGGGTFEYHNDPEKTAQSYNEQGWSTLGDIGYLDEEGYLYLTDRTANMIISGGVNIYPQEAENLLVTHPKVVDAAVFGVPNPDFGEEVKAVVQLAPGCEAGPELERELITYCEAQLARLKCPRSIDFERELPRHPNGKLYKRLLKQRYWGGHQTTII
jgi:acyl-CoA synthetase (AMP-forming)/AMP-acid ligase II